MGCGTVGRSTRFAKRWSITYRVKCASAKNKEGFSNPRGDWAKHELINSATETFSPNSLVSRKGIVNNEALLCKYDRFCRQASARCR